MNAQIDILLKANQSGKWTEQQFRALSTKDLRSLVTAKGDATPALSPELKKLIAERDWTTGDQLLAAKVLCTPEVKTVAHHRPEVHLTTTGGSFVYTPQLVENVRLNGEKFVRANAPIPARYNEKDLWHNQQAVTAFCGQYVAVTQGTWKSTCNLEPVQKVYGPGRQLDVPALKNFSNTVADLLNADSVWNTMIPTMRNAVTGEEALCFIREALGRLEVATYDFLNSMIVCKVLCCFRRSGDQWVISKDNQGVPLVPKSCYVARPTTQESLKNLKKAGFAGCFYYLGGLIPKMAFPAAESTLKSVRENMSRASEVQGAQNSVTSILGQMRGYSGLTDAFGKRIQFLLGSALYAWYLHRPAYIVLQTTGDVGILVSSLNRWSQFIKQSKSKFFSRKVDGHDVVSPCVFKFMLPNINDKSKVNSMYHSFLSLSPLKESIIIAHYGGTIPTAETAGTVVKYDELSYNLIPEALFCQSTDLIVYSVIYGINPFKSDEDAKRRLATSSAELGEWPRDVFVYSFGSAAYCRGVLSTLPEFHLVGYGGVGIANQSDFSFINLDRMKDQAQWYSCVISDARTQCASWLSPISRYSPISNLPYVSKAGVTIAVTQVVSEKGELIGNSFSMLNPGLQISEEVVEYDDELIDEVGDDNIDGDLEIVEEVVYGERPDEVPKATNDENLGIMSSDELANTDPDKL